MSKPFIRLGVLLLLMVSFTSCNPGPQEFGVLEGQVSIGPLVPVMREGEDPPTPAPEVYAAREIVVYKNLGTIFNGIMRYEPKKKPIFISHNNVRCGFVSSKNSNLMKESRGELASRK